MLFATFISVHSHVFFAEKSKAQFTVKWEGGLAWLLERGAISCRQSSWQLPARFSPFPALNIQHLSLDPKALYKLGTKNRDRFTCPGNTGGTEGADGSVLPELGPAARDWSHTTWMC